MARDASARITRDLDTIKCENLCYSLDNIVRVLLSHCCKNGKREHALIRGLRNRAISFLRPETIPIKRVHMHGNIVHIHPKPLRTQRLEDLYAIRREFRK